MVVELDQGLSHLAELIKEQLAKDIADIPGAGAAGGFGAGAIAFMNAKLVSGIETVIAQSALAEAIPQADWIISGEGQFDAQSLRGKVVWGILEIAKKCTSPPKIAVLAGRVTLSSADYRKYGLTDAMGIMKKDMTVDYAIKNAEKLLAETAQIFAKKHLK